MDRTCRAADQRGSATTFTVPLIGVVLAATLVVSVLASVLVGQRRVQSAADLAALAGATAVQQGHDACAVVALMARRNGSEVASCSVSGGDVTIELSRRVTGLVGRSVTVRARTRAGPAALHDLDTSP